MMSFLKTHTKIDFLKIDCEGCEVELVPMINKIYSRNPQCHVAGEFHEWHLRRCAANVSSEAISSASRALCRFENRRIERLQC